MSAYERKPDLVAGVVAAGAVMPAADEARVDAPTGAPVRPSHAAQEEKASPNPRAAVERYFYLNYKLWAVVRPTICYRDDIIVTQ